MRVVCCVSSCRAIYDLNFFPPRLMTTHLIDRESNLLAFDFANDGIGLFVDFDGGCYGHVLYQILDELSRHVGIHIRKPQIVG